MLRFGNISEIDPGKCYARVKFMDDEIVSDWLQICVLGALNTKFFHIFDINEQVACLMDENSEDGVIIGAVYSDGVNPDSGDKDEFKIKFPDNSVIKYNRELHVFTLDIKGTINIVSDSEVNVTSPITNINGNLNVSGTIQGGVITDGTINLTTHKHSGVSTGGGTSGPAVP